MPDFLWHHAGLTPRETVPVILAEAAAHRFVRSATGKVHVEADGHALCAATFAVTPVDVTTLPPVELERQFCRQCASVWLWRRRAARAQAAAAAGAGGASATPPAREGDA